MQTWSILDVTHFLYGYGTMGYDLVSPHKPDITSPYFMIGHIGADWGSGGVSLYSPTYNFSISVASNSMYGMNCSYKSRIFP